MSSQVFIQQTKELIDDLKSICANHGLGNDANEFKIITQVFLYKFFNDKFAYELKNIDKSLKESQNWEEKINLYTEEEYNRLLKRLSENCIKFEKQELLYNLFHEKGKKEFYKTFDKTLVDLSMRNSDIFSVVTESKSKIQLFEEISKSVVDEHKRDAFCSSIVDKLIKFSFENIFSEKFDFFSTIFEYLIKDYNSDSGGKYAEYYTPHAVAKIMAEILVDKGDFNVTCYDPSAGSGTLLMNLAHVIGEDNCSIFSQDISQKSSHLLRLNLILNSLVHSIHNIAQGNTLIHPAHKENNDLMKFDYIVSNPPFKLDFSDYVGDLDTKENRERFFAGLPKATGKDLSKMAIYTTFIQHIMYSLSEKGKAAIVVPTGFITAQSGIEKKIREKIINEKMLKGVVSMPSNIFATTGTNVSIILLDKTNKSGEVILMDASKLGTTIKDGKNQKTLLSEAEEDKIIEIFHKHLEEKDLSVKVSYEEIAEKNYSFSAGQYFDVEIEYVELTAEEFKDKIGNFQANLDRYFAESKALEEEIQKQLKLVEYEK